MTGAYFSEKQRRVLTWWMPGSPDENQEAYLQLLSSISRKLRNPALIEELITNVGNPAGILAALADEEK